MRVGSQGEPLMQIQREHDQKAGTGEIRMETIASESMNVSDAEKEKLFQQEYQVVIDYISLDVETFTHPVTAYQLLAGQGNEEAEKLLNLVHTTASMQRAKDVITAILPIASDDVDYGTGGSEDIFGDEDDGEGEFMDIMEKQTVTIGITDAHSLYFLNLFGLRGLFSLIVGEENAIDDTQCMMQMSGFGFNPSKVEREVERDNEVARMESVFSVLLLEQSLAQETRNPDHRLLASVNNHSRQLATSLETVKWQLEVFYNKINPLRSVKNLLSSYGTRGYRSFTKKWEDAEE
ncbi:hypothetical protein AgCh_018005 [Apium graveolens]